MGWESTNVRGIMKCTFCVDDMITAESQGLPEIPSPRDAVLLVPYTQVHTAQAFGQPPVVSTVALPCCMEHRKAQMSASNGKLLRA